MILRSKDHELISYKRQSGQTRMEDHRTSIETRTWSLQSTMACIETKYAWAALPWWTWSRRLNGLQLALTSPGKKCLVLVLFASFSISIWLYPDFTCSSPGSTSFTLSYHVSWPLPQFSRHDTSGCRCSTTGTSGTSNWRQRCYAHPLRWGSALCVEACLCSGSGLRLGHCWRATLPGVGEPVTDMVTYSLSHLKLAGIILITCRSPTQRRSRTDYDAKGSFEFCHG